MGRLLTVVCLAGVSDDVPVVAGADSAILQQHLDPSLGHALGDEWGFQQTEFPPLMRTAAVGAEHSGTGAQLLVGHVSAICSFSTKCLKC